MVCRQTVLATRQYGSNLGNLHLPRTYIVVIPMSVQRKQSAPTSVSPIMSARFTVLNSGPL